jgi:hypothetical protein
VIDAWVTRHKTRLNNEFDGQKHGKEKPRSYSANQTRHVAVGSASSDSSIVRPKLRHIVHTIISQTTSELLLQCSHRPMKLQSNLIAEKTPSSRQNQFPQTNYDLHYLCMVETRSRRHISQQSPNCHVTMINLWSTQIGKHCLS